LDLTEQIDREFSQIASLPDDRIDLAHGALLIAKAAYPDLEEPIYLERLDRMAARAVEDWKRFIAHIGDHESVAEILARIDKLKKQPSRIH